MSLTDEKQKEFSKALLATVEDALAEAGVSGRRASLDAVGHDGLVRDIRAGRIPGADKLSALAAVLELEFYFGPRRTTEEVLTEPAALVIENGVFVQLPLHAALLAAGQGFRNGAEDVVGHIAFRRDWLRQLGVSSRSAVLARAQGDSMRPSISDGDVILIDTARKVPPGIPRARGDRRNARVFAFLDDGDARVKRIQHIDDRTLILLSDNPDYSPEIRDVTSIDLIGRVMWWGHAER